MSRVIIVHGWGGSPETDFLPWVKQELEKKGYEVIAPAMPDTEHPKIETWVPHLKEVVGEVRPDDILIGHSMGCQTILRYLEGLQEGQKVEKIILVAGFIELMGLEPNELEIRDAWLNTPLNFEKVKSHANKFIAIFSDNDPVVPLEVNRKVFEEKLKAEIFIEQGKGHFNDMPQERPDLLKFFKVAGD
ncbi:MAG: alpha/beta fold hydrolase [Candidatus Daviesbacteria bacterium]|nr:alpha/beta fold hydrolase [Candidatus Daviesbacteria bacterium]